MSPTAQNEAAARILEALRLADSDEDRREIMSSVLVVYCRFCWAERKGQSCHCWNDE